MGGLIVFEGGDCSGKDTQIAYLQKILPSDKFIFTREPGGTIIGQEIRQLLLSNSSENMSAGCELLLFNASRAQLITEVIRPALKAGKFVIMNRFFLSTLAYQIYGRQKMELLALFNNITSLVLEDIRPDLHIFIDIKPEKALARLAGRKEEENRLDREDIDFHQRIYQGYLEGLKNLTHIKIEGDKEVEEIRKDILTELDKSFPQENFSNYI